MTTQVHVLTNIEENRMIVASASVSYTFATKSNVAKMIEEIEDYKGK
jgi:hypothetical protein